MGLVYRWRHGRWPDLEAPARFTERVQWRKLNDRDPALAGLTDKLRGKELARERLGEGSVIATLWSGSRLPAGAPGAFPLVVKANHGCNQTIVVRDAADWDRARRETPGWMTAPYGEWLDEWHYRSARRLLLVEPFVGPADGLPLDYKIYVFGGRAEMVQVHLDRSSDDHRWIQLDRQWRRLSTDDGRPLPDQPDTLINMLEAAETLAGDQDFLRVDFYEIDGAMLFGEFCLFPGSGLDPFDPPALDDRLGALWLGGAPHRNPEAGRAGRGDLRPWTPAID